MKHQIIAGEPTYSPRETFLGVLVMLALGPLVVLAVAVPAALVAAAALALLVRPALRVARTVRTDAPEDASVARPHAR